MAKQNKRVLETWPPNCQATGLEKPLEKPSLRLVHQSDRRQPRPSSVFSLRRKQRNHVFTKEWSKAESVHSVWPPWFSTTDTFVDVTTDALWTFHDNHWHAFITWLYFERRALIWIYPNWKTWGKKRLKPYSFKRKTQHSSMCMYNRIDFCSHFQDIVI